MEVKVDLSRFRPYTVRALYPSVNSVVCEYRPNGKKEVVFEQTFSAENFFYLERRCVWSDPADRQVLENEAQALGLTLSRAKDLETLACLYTSVRFVLLAMNNDDKAVAVVLDAPIDDFGIDPWDQPELRFMSKAATQSRGDNEE